MYVNNASVHGRPTAPARVTSAALAARVKSCQIENYGLVRYNGRTFHTAQGLLKALLDGAQ